MLLHYNMWHLLIQKTSVLERLSHNLLRRELVIFAQMLVAFVIRERMLVALIKHFKY